MGKYIDQDQPYSEELKEFLRGRGRGDEIIENERRFPPDGEPAEHEEAGFMPHKPGYDYAAQADKIEDAGGREIDRIPTDDRGFPLVPEYDPEDDDTDADVDDDGIDDDILNRVIDLTVDELKDELRTHEAPVSGNKDELIDRLANLLQDERDKAVKGE